MPHKDNQISFSPKTVDLARRLQLAVIAIRLAEAAGTPEKDVELYEALVEIEDQKDGSRI